MQKFRQSRDSNMTVLRGCIPWFRCMKNLLRESNTTSTRTRACRAQLRNDLVYEIKNWMAYPPPSDNPRQVTPLGWRRKTRTVVTGAGVMYVALMVWTLDSVRYS
ncbi:hypothetical protein BDN67DRAFT_1006055 [Paxillus ammoniavirescens]|nr:hypothetical protein BDN67DRAFT_1006055 [Paxillus ammoniavirescens]